MFFFLVSSSRACLLNPFAATHSIKIFEISCKTGEGIPKDKIDLIFEEYAVLKDGQVHNQKIGLGLSIAKGLAEVAYRDHGSGPSRLVKNGADRMLSTHSMSRPSTDPCSMNSVVTSCRQTLRRTE